MTGRVYTAREVADMERIHLVTMYTYLKEGRFPGAYKSGSGARSAWRIPEEAVRRHRQSFSASQPASSRVVGIEPYSARSRKRKRVS